MMAWWQDSDNSHDSERIEGSAPLRPLHIPGAVLRPMPSQLDELLQLSKVSGQSLNHVQSWRAVTAFAQHHWLADATDAADSLKGEFFALKHAVADQLGLDDDAEAARLDWLHWAQDTGIQPAIFHARSYATHTEAEKFIDANPGNALTGRKPADAEVPQLVELAADILRTQPSRESAYHFALSAAVTGAAAALARRNDIAEALSQWTAKWAPKRSGADDRRLLEAQVAHCHGKLATAAAICAEVAEHPISEPVTSTIEARQMLAYLCLEAEEESEAIRQLQQFVEPALEAGLAVATLRSVRLLTALLNADSQCETAKRIGLLALSQTTGMPISPLIMDIQLITARSLLDCGEYDEALHLAEPVAQWSEFTSDEERTDTAYDIAIAAAKELAQTEKSLELVQDHAAHLTRIGDKPGASHALQQAARILAFHHRIDEAEGCVDKARALIGSDWEIARWQMTVAYVLWSADRLPEFFETIQNSSVNYALAGDVEAAAEALLQGVYCAKEIGDGAHVRDFAGRIQKLLPSEHWDGHPVLGVLAEYLAEDR